MSRIGIGLLVLVVSTNLALAQEPPRADGWVVLALDEYHDLRLRAYPQPTEPAPPPVDAVLTRIDYTLRVGDDTATGEARLAVDVLKPGWIGVRLPPGLLARGVRLDARAITMAPGDPPQVFLQRSGRSILVLDVVVPVETSGGTESIALPPSNASVSTLTLTLPRTDFELSVQGGLVTEQVDAPAETRWSMIGTPAQPLSVSWKRRTEDRRGSLPLRTRVNLTQAVALGESASLVTASVRMEVAQGTARELVLHVPAGTSITAVNGAAVAEWRHEQEQLTISFLEPVTTQASFLVSGETRLPPAGTVAIPLLRARTADRETGGVAVDVHGAGDIAARRPEGLEPADPADFGDPIAARASPAMAAFRFRVGSGTTHRALSVDVTRYTLQAVPVAVIDEARYDALLAEDGKLLVRARYAVRNNQRSFLAVTLPAGASLWSASLVGRTVRPGVSASGPLLLPLRKGRAGEDPPVFAVEFTYLQRTAPWADRGEARIELPTVDLPISRTGAALGHSPRYRLEVRPGAFRVDEDSGPWSVALRAISAAPAAPSARQAGDVFDSKAVTSGSRAASGILPIEIGLPTLGQSIFMAAELTAENRPAVIELRFKRENDR